MRNAIFINILILALTSTLVFADSITKTYTFSSGSLANASEVNTNFDTLYDSVNNLIGTIIVSSSKVGIGTTSPDNQFHMVSTTFLEAKFQSAANTSTFLFFSDGSQNEWGIGHDYANDGSDNFQINEIGSGPRLVILTGGKVGIGTTSPTQLLDVDANIAVQGSTVHTSDVRLKKDITTIPDSLAKVMQLRGVSFRWIDQQKDAEMGPQYGVIAQEVEAVFPNAVITDDKGYKSVAYSKLVAPMIEAIKEQQGMIKSQQQTIEQQKKDIAALKTLLTQTVQQMTQRMEKVEASIIFQKPQIKTASLD